MKNKSDNTNGQQKRDSATRSAGKQATGNRNKHLLAAERRRTDKPHGRLNKQNPVSPQNGELVNQSDEPSKNAGLNKSKKKIVNETINNISKLRNWATKEGYFELDKSLYDAHCTLKQLRMRIITLH